MNYTIHVQESDYGYNESWLLISNADMSDRFYVSFPVNLNIHESFKELACAMMWNLRRYAGLKHEI